MILDVSPTADGKYTLTLDEVIQICTVTAKAELIDLQMKNMTLFWEVWKEKVHPQEA